MDIIKKYTNMIIVPLEKEINHLRTDFYTKKTTFNKNEDKEHLKRMEKLLLEYYRKFEIFIDK